MFANVARVSILSAVLASPAFAQPQPEPPPPPVAEPSDQAPPPPPEPKPEVPPPAPMPQIPAPPPAPVVVHEGGISKTDVLLVGGAGVALGASVVLFMAAHSDADDANAAALFQDHEDIAARSRRLYLASGITAAGAIALGVTAFLHIRSSSESSTSVAIAPHAGGGSLVIGGSW